MPEYFGYGRIGTVWRDETIPESTPKKDWAWYCSIDEYLPFPASVPAKLDGEFLERIARNHWSVGIRPLPQDVYDRIVELAGILPKTNQDAAPFPDLTTLTITETTDYLLLPRKPATAGAPTDAASPRYSKNALPIGRRAEEIVRQFLVENAEQLGATNIRWVAQEGSTPGWDLQYEHDGRLVAVELTLVHDDRILHKHQRHKRKC